MSTPSEPQPPAAPEGSRSPSTQEIPVIAPTGATAVGKQLPPDAVAPAPAPLAAPQPTGPVDFVPGLPGLGTPPVPPPAPAAQPPTAIVPPAPAAQPPRGIVPPGPAPAEPPAVGEQPAASSWPDTLEADNAATKPRRKLRTARGPQNRPALAALGLSALAVVLLVTGLSLDFGSESFWAGVPLWSAFALLCALLGLIAFAASSSAADRLGPGRTWRVAAAGLVGLSVFWLLVVLPRVDTDRGFVLTAALVCLGGALWIGSRPRT